MSILDRFRKREAAQPDMVHVPEDHTLVTVRFAMQAYCSRYESGIWVADFGPHMLQAREHVLAAVADVLRKEPTAAIIWVIQGSAMAGWCSEPSRLTGWLRDLYRVVQLRIRQAEDAHPALPVAFWVTGPSSLSEWLSRSVPVTRHPIAPGDIAVVPDLGANAETLRRLLCGLGFNVRLPAPQNDVVVVEIHRPDGSIEVLMPGPTYPCEPDRTLHQLYLEGDAANQQVDAATRVPELEARQVALIAQLMHEILFLGEPNRLTLPELVIRIADEAEPSQAILDAFYSALLAGQVGARVPDSFGPVLPGKHVVQPGEKIGIPTMMLPDGNNALRVFCDIPGMQALHTEAQYFELAGADALVIARDAGIGLAVVNETGGRESWVGLTKEQVLRILADRDR